MFFLTAELTEMYCWFIFVEKEMIKARHIYYYSSWMTKSIYYTFSIMLLRKL